MRKWSKSAKRAQFWPLKNNLYSDSTKSLWYVVKLMSSQISFMPKRRKGYWSVSEIAPPPLKVDADYDGRVGIWKAPLPDGTAELKSVHVTQTRTWSEPLHEFEHMNIDSLFTWLDQKHIQSGWWIKILYYIDNNATRSPEISRQHVQKLTPPPLSTGHKWQLAPRCRALGTMIKKSYHDDRRLSTCLSSKILSPSSLGRG